MHKLSIPKTKKKQKQRTYEKYTERGSESECENKYVKPIQLKLNVTII